MTKQNSKPVLVAEINVAEAEHLMRELAKLSRRARPATSVEQILEVLRSEILHEAIVAVDLDIEDRPALVHLARLPATELLVAVGPADETEMEIRARRAGARVYLPRPVTAEMLSGLPWIHKQTRLHSSSAARPRRWTALAGLEPGGLVPAPAFVREPGGRRVFFKKEVHDTGQTSSFSPFFLPGL